MQTTVRNIEELFESIKTDLAVCANQKYGWKAAAVRIRKASLEIQKNLKQFRKISIAEAKK